MGDLTDLVSSINNVGVLEPILVRCLELRDSSKNATQAFVIISGERRYRAAMEAGLADIPAIVMNVSEDEALEIALIENLQRKDLTPFEEAEGFRALAERFNYTHEQISGAIGKSRTVITESLALLQIPPVVRDVATALGVTTKSILLELLKVNSAEEMIQLLEEVSRRGLSRDDLRSRLRTSKLKDGSTRRRPYIFNYRSPDQRFKLSLKFRDTDVSQAEVITILERIITEMSQGLPNQHRD